MCILLGRLKDNMNLMRLFWAGVLTAAAPFAATAGPVYYLVTAQSGANTTIDAAHLTQWFPSSLGQSCLVSSCADVTVADFAPTFNWLLGGGNFTIKRGVSTSDSITLDLWDGPLGGTPGALTGTNLASVTLAAASVATSYTPTDFLFSTPVLMQTGHHYIATFTSVASTSGADQYFIKSPQVLTIQTTGDVPIILTDPGSAAPEPSTWAMMVGFLAVAVYAKRNRFSHSFSR